MSENTNVTMKPASPWSYIRTARNVGVRRAFELYKSNRLYYRLGNDLIRIEDDFMAEANRMDDSIVDETFDPESDYYNEDVAFLVVEANKAAAYRRSIGYYRENEEDPIFYDDQGNIDEDVELVVDDS